MWWRGSALLLAFALATVVVAPTPSNAPSITDVEQRPVMIALLPCQPSVQATASGFVIADGLVVTVAHAVYETRDFAVRDSTGVWHRPAVRYLDLERDLALLEIPGVTASAVDMRPAQPGDHVRMLAGAASGTIDGEVIRRVRLTTEAIGDLTETTARSGYELSVDITGGDSGAAVLDDQGRLVGLVFAESTRREASWATSVTEIEAIIDRTGGPTWQCERESNTELFLAPLEPDS